METCEAGPERKAGFAHTHGGERRAREHNAMAKTGPGMVSRGGRKGGLGSKSEQEGFMIKRSVCA